MPKPAADTAIIPQQCYPDKQSWVETHQNTDTTQIPRVETKSAGRGA